MKNVKFRKENGLILKKIYDNEKLKDEAFGKVILTQPAAIKLAVDFSNQNKCVKFFDAGDVQANGFQIAEDMNPDDTFTETGASYMGFLPALITRQQLQIIPGTQ